MNLTWEKTVRAGCLLLFILLPTASNATPILWTLEGQVEGEFTYDADINQYSLVHLLHVNLNEVFSGVSLGDATGFVTTPSPGTWVLGLSFSAPLTNAGGLVNYWITQCDQLSSDVACLTFVSGNDIAYTETTLEVPEPGTTALFAIGLAGLGFARRRRRRSAASA